MSETINRTPHTRTASYLAEPSDVGRVLLLYSGGLDTSVMLKWIADEQIEDCLGRIATLLAR